MIKQNSLLKRLPHGLGKRQIVFLDALRLSAEMAGQAYEDLICELNKLGSGEGANERRNFVTPVRHAWGIVDAVHRFGEIHRVRLELANHLLILSDVILYLAEMFHSLEKSIEKFAAGKERFNTDRLVHFKFLPIE